MHGNYFFIISKLISFINNFTYAAGDIYILFGGTDYLLEDESVAYRVKRFSYACIRAVYENRYFLGYFFTCTGLCFEFRVLLQLEQFLICIINLI